MAVTHKLIQSITVGAGGQASIEFTSIPQTYTDLLIVGSIRTNRSSVVDNLQIEFNGASTNLSFTLLFGGGTSAASASGSYGLVGDANAATSTASVFSSHSIYIPSYSGSTNKSFSVDSVSENNATEAYQEILSGLWSVTSAITSLRLFPRTGTLLNQYSSASLYGIKNS
jgi:hypothetical protein